MSSLIIKYCKGLKGPVILLFLIAGTWLQASAKSLIPTDTVSFTKENSLELAENAFDNGQYPEVNGYLKNYYKTFNKNEKIRADQLYARLMIELDNADSASQYIYRIIKLDPLYSPPEDRVQHDFLKQYKEFKVRPQFSVSFGLGMNRGYVSNTAIHAIYQGDKYQEKTSSRTGNQFFFLVDTYFSKQLSLQTGISFARYQYQKTYTFESEFASLYSEELNYFEVPVLINFQVFRSESGLFGNVKGGVNISFLDEAMSDIELTDLENSVENENIIFNKSTFLTGVSMEDSRRKVIPDLFAGIEFGYGKKRSSVGLGFDFLLALTRTTKENDLLVADEDLTFYHYHNDNQFKINKLRLSLFYRYVFNYRIRPKL